MSDLKDNKAPKEKIAPLDDPDKLGLSRGIYAAGNSLKDTVIWGTLTTLASIAILAFGRAKGNAVDKVALKLEAIHGAIRGGVAKGIEKVGELFGKEKIEGKEVFTPATTAAAVIAGTIVGHIVQLPAGVSGWKKAQKATDKYARLREENKSIANENQLLAEEVARLNAALEQVRRPDPAAKHETAASRGA